MLSQRAHLLSRSLRPHSIFLHAARYLEEVRDLLQQRSQFGADRAAFETRQLQPSPTDAAQQHSRPENLVGGGIDEHDIQL